MPQEQEIDLVRKAKDGDTVAFAEIICRYQNLVYATAFRILKDSALAEDVARFLGIIEVIPLAKKENCGCGCVPPGKTTKQKVKTVNQARISRIIPVSTP